VLQCRTVSTSVEQHAPAQNSEYQRRTSCTSIKQHLPALDNMLQCRTGCSSSGHLVLASI
ncbi:hypothetical protein COEREDRAFT_48903, partial [Coemansia reversa NRRL 1564]